MNHLKNRSKRTSRGQGLLEYIALTALVAIVSLSAVKLLGSKVKTHVTRATGAFDRTMRAGFNAARSAPTEDNDGGAPDAGGMPRTPSPTRRAPSQLPWPF